MAECQAEGISWGIQNKQNKPQLIPGKRDMTLTRRGFALAWEVRALQRESSVPSRVQASRQYKSRVCEHVPFESGKMLACQHHAVNIQGSEMAGIQRYQNVINL